MEALITVHNFDIAHLSETLSNTTATHNDENININSYSLLRVDHPKSIKLGGVCLYFE